MSKFDSPYLILGLPRSRTAWLSRFLSYGIWACGHDEVRHLRQMEDVRAWLEQPCTGSAETAAAPFWRLLLHLRPDVRLVVIRRDPDEAARSAVRAGLNSNLKATTALFRRLDHKLGQIERRAPNVRSFLFEDLAREEVCADLFEHCLPYPHDSGWWAALDGENVQINALALRRYVRAHAPQISRMRGIAARHSFALMAGGKPPHVGAGVTIGAEKLADLLRDGVEAMGAHLVAVGEAPDNWANKNLELMQKLEDAGALQVVVARCNGKVFGYLVTALCPSLEARDVLSSHHGPFWADPAFPGLGLKLQRAANALLKERGASEIFMRAGARGEGPRLGALYRRQGAEPLGELYRIQCEGRA